MKLFFKDIVLLAHTTWEQPQGPMIPTEPSGGVYQNLVIATSGQTLIKNFGNKNALPNLT